MSDSTTTQVIGSEESLVSPLKANKPKPVRGWASSKNGPLHWNQTGTIMAGDIRSVEKKKERKTWMTFDRSTLSVHLLKANLAEDGCEEAQLDIAKKLLEDSEDVLSSEAVQGENRKKAIYWLIKSAEQGNEEATTLLNQCLKTGQGITHQNISDVRSCVATPKKEKFVFKAVRRLHDKLSNGEEFITTTQILEFITKESTEEKENGDDDESEHDRESPNRAFVLPEEDDGSEETSFPKWATEEIPKKPVSLHREKDGVKLTKGDLLNVAKSYNNGDVPDVAISGQVWGTRHYQSLFYYLSTFLVQFLLLSMMLKALTIYSVLLVGTSWVLLWSTYGFLVWHKGLSIFEEWTRAFAQVLGNITVSDFSSEPKLVSKNLIPVYALSSVGLLSLQFLNAPPVLVIILGLFNCFGIIRGVKNYRIRWQTSFMIVSTICTSSFIVSGCLQQLYAIPEEDLASANEILSVAMLALKRTLEEYVGILPAISLHVTVAVVNFAIMAESYLQTRQVTNVLEQLVLYAWFAKSVYLLPSITASGFCCLLSVAIVLGTLFYLLDANKGLWTIFVGTLTSLLFVILVIISVELISRAAKEDGGVVKSLSWKEYSENCHRKAWESTSVAQTRIECSRKYERVPTWVSWTGKVSSVKVISVEPLFADGIQDEVSFEVLVNVASSPWEVDSEAGGAWNLLSGAGKEKELLSIVSVTVSTKDIIGSEGKMEAVNRLLSLNPGDVVRVQGLLQNGAGSLKPEIGRVNLSRCYYCEDNADTEAIFMLTESLCSRLLGGLEEYLGSELLAILGEAEFTVRHYLNATLYQI